MNCSQCQENFTAYSACELPATTQEAVALHLADCSDCRVELEKQEQLFLLLDREENVSAAALPRFQLRLQTELAQANKAVASPLMLWFQKLWPSRPAWAFAYSLVLLGCGLTGGQLLPPGALGLRDPAAGMQATQSSENTALVCPVQTAPSAWLPATTISSLT